MFLSEEFAVYEIAWKNMVRTGQATDDNKMRRKRFVCWINNTTDTHSEYVTLIAFPCQQWLRERALLLPYTRIACLVI